MTRYYYQNLEVKELNDKINTNKLFAFGLLDRMQSNYEISEQYVKSGKIFYKIKDSNLAVTKKLNNIDYSLLGVGETEYILNVINLPTFLNNKNVEEKVKEFSERVDRWSSENSLPVTMERIEEYYKSFEFRKESDIKDLEKTKSLIGILLDKKIKINRREELLRPGEENFIELHIDISDKNNIISIAKNAENIDQLSLLNNMENNHLDILRTVLTIIQYGEGLNSYNQETFDKYTTAISMLSYMREDTFHVRFENNSATTEMIDLEKKNIIDAISKNILKDSSGYRSYYSSYNTILMEMLNDGSLGGYYSYYNYGDFMRYIEFPVNLNIKYEEMPDSHLLLFRESVNNIIDKQASYVSVREKEFMSIMLYLGKELLKGKKKTKERLTDHFNLNEMNEEIKRRGL